MRAPELTEPQGQREKIGFEAKTQRKPFSQGGNSHLHHTVEISPAQCPFSTVFENNPLEPFLNNVAKV
jgi:hypothetical protein